jgi:hypothetical protein
MSSVAAPDSLSVEAMAKLTQSILRERTNDGLGAVPLEASRGRLD